MPLSELGSGQSPIPQDHCLWDLIVWHRLDPSDVGMVVDRGHDFPSHIQAKLDSYGSDMWLFRDDPTRGTTKALNHYRGDHRGSVDCPMFFPDTDVLTCDFRQGD